jgi:hypothetical protein
MTRAASPSRALLFPLLLLLLPLLACGCHGVADDGAAAATAPFAAGVAVTDVADRACRVVLRRADRVEGAPPLVAATLDVDAALLADPGATPGVLYRADGGAWQAVTAAASVGAPAGFVRFIARFAVSNAADFVPFATTTTAVRLFDHNRLPGDFDSYHVDASTGFGLGDPGVCAGQRPLATLSFNGGYTEAQHGAIVAGDVLSVEYDLGRLTTCRATHNGDRFWTLDAYARFEPDGQVVSGTVVASNGSSVYPTPFVTDVPAGATAVALWFKNASPPDCEGWDSNFGANYVFPVVAAATAPIGWTSGVGGSTDRACQHADTLEDPIVIDEYARERACLFADVDVWIPGVTDGSAPHPEYVLAEVEWAKDGAAPPTRTWLDDVGRAGNNERFRWQLPYELRNQADWTTASYSLRVSTDGRTWTYAEGGHTRTITRAFTLPSP